MEFINSIITWLEANWGQALFGSVSLGSVVTLIIMFVKSWLANKAQGTKYEDMWNTAQKTYGNLKELYEKEKADKQEVQAENIFLQATQNVMFDAIMKMAISSKLDAEDKISIVANVEKLKQMAPKEIIEDAKEKVNTVVDNVQKEVEENPTQTAYNVVNNVTSLLDKYSSKGA